MMALADKERGVATPGKLNIEQALAAAVFLGPAALLATVVPTFEIARVSGLLILAICLFALEVVSVEVAAISTSILMGLEQGRVA